MHQWRMRIQLYEMMRLPLRPLHRFVAFVAVLLIPLASLLLGSGRFAWTMFSQPRPYRLNAFGVDSNGKHHWIAPTALGALLGGEAKRYLAGAEQWRPAPVGDVFAAHLDEFAREACRLGPYTSVTLNLEDKPSLQGFGAKGAEGDPKPQMFNEGFGAKGAEGDPKPQMFNEGPVRKTIANAVCTHPQL